MDTFNIGDKVKVRGTKGILNTGVIVDLESDDKDGVMALVKFFDETTEWFGFISLTKLEP